MIESRLAHTNRKSRTRDGRFERPALRRAQRALGRRGGGGLAVVSWVVVAVMISARVSVFEC